MKRKNPFNFRGNIIFLFITAFLITGCNKECSDNNIYVRFVDKDQKTAIPYTGKDTIIITHYSNGQWDSIVLAGQGIKRRIDSSGLTSNAGDACPGGTAYEYFEYTYMGRSIVTDTIYRMKIYNPGEILEKRSSSMVKFLLEKKSTELWNSIVIWEYASYDFSHKPELDSLEIQNVKHFNIQTRNYYDDNLKTTYIIYYTEGYGMIQIEFKKKEEIIIFFH